MKRGIEPKTVQAYRGLVESLTDHLQVEVCSLQVVLQVDLHVLGLGQLQCRLVVHVLHMSVIIFVSIFHVVPFLLISNSLDLASSSAVLSYTSCTCQ
jgi:hypothetical protein